MKFVTKGHDCFLSEVLGTLTLQLHSATKQQEMSVLVWGWGQEGWWEFTTGSRADGRAQVVVLSLRSLLQCRVT